MILEWDLSGLPLAGEQTGWEPDPFATSIDSHLFEPIERVHFTFNEQSFEVTEHVHDVTITTEDKWILHLQVDYKPMTVEDAAQALRQIDLPVPEYVVDEWVESTEGAEGQQVPKLRTGDVDQTGYGNAAVGVRTRYSFNDKRPVIISVVVSWADAIRPLRD